MNLRTWRLQEGMSQEYMALELEIDQAYLSKVELGRRRAGPDLAYRIGRLTRGKVTLKDLGREV